jgi:outer membrane protein assembly factor BamB
MDERLYIGSNGHVSAIDPRTGAEVWRTKLQQGLITSTGAADVSVIVRDSVIYAGSAGHLFALSTDGTILWENSLKGLGYNDVSLAFEGISIQYLQKVERNNSAGGNS